MAQACGRPGGHELPWLYRTAGFLVANHHRKGRPTPVETLPDEADRSSVEHVVVSDLEVRAVFATLSLRDRQVLLLAAWEGLRGDGLAEALGISRGGADAALSRARARLRDAWQDADRDPGSGTVPGTGALPDARSQGSATQTG